MRPARGRLLGVDARAGVSSSTGFQLLFVDVPIKDRNALVCEKDRLIGLFDQRLGGAAKEGFAGA